MPPARLTTKSEWDTFNPKTQGYIVYCQAMLPGSELKDLKCPYALGSPEAKEYAAGEFTAMMDSQDGEE